MKILIPSPRHWLSAILLLFVVPQVLAECVFHGTAIHDVLIHLSIDPIFGLGLMFGAFPPEFWWLDAICALLWFFSLSVFIGHCERHFEKQNLACHFRIVQFVIVLIAILSYFIPRGNVAGTIESEVLQKLSPGMTFSESRSFVPRQWRSGMYYGMKIDDLVISQDERLSGYFYPEKDWSKAKKEFSITHELPDGSEEHAYLYFDENGKLLFWKYCPG